MEYVNTSSKQKYFRNDKIFHSINKLFLSLKSDDVRRINSHLHLVITTVLEKMKSQDYFFNKVYQTILFGGSYYKKTRICAPTEFDIDIIIKLPINYGHIKVIQSDYPGFVNIYSGLQLNNLTNDSEINRSLIKLLDENMYFDQGMFRNWIESILSKALNDLPKSENKFILIINNNEYRIRIKKSGPAFTLQIHFSDNETIDVDLVPVLEFSKDPPNVDLHCYTKQNWFAVPKPLYSYNGNSQIFWRTCFYEQEKEILSKNGKIKEVIKLMKKLRDTQNWINLASYYIETLALHEVQSNSLLKTKSITVLFMEMLHKLHNSLINKRITYYWDGKFNILSKLSDAEIVNIEKRLNRIIQTIYKLIDSDEYIIASYILNPIELRTLKFQINSEQSTEHEQRTETQSRCMIL